MQWAQMTFLEDSLTIADLLKVGQDLIDRAKFILRTGRKSRIKFSGIQYAQLPTVVALSCSVEHLIKARTALQSWMEMNESVNGRTLLMNVSKASDGFVECLQMSDAVLLCLNLLGLWEDLLF